MYDVRLQGGKGRIRRLHRNMLLQLVGRKRVMKVRGKKAMSKKQLNFKGQMPTDEKLQRNQRNGDFH